MSELVGHDRAVMGRIHGVRRWIVRHGAVPEVGARGVGIAGAEAETHVRLRIGKGIAARDGIFQPYAVRGFGEGVEYASIDGRLSVALDPGERAELLEGLVAAGGA